jgi:MFS family permease
MMVGSLLSALAYSSYAIVRPFWPFLAMRFVEGAALACLDTAVLAFIVKLVPRTYRGQAIGYVLLAPLSRWPYQPLQGTASMAYALEYAGSSGGTAVGTYQATGDLGTALGPVMMGVVVSLAGYRTMYFCLALLCVMNIGYFRFFVRKRRHIAVRTP